MARIFDSHNILKMKILIMGKNQLPPHLLVLSMCLQFLFYVIIINNQSLMHSIISNLSPFEYSDLILLLLIILVKYLMQVSLLKFVYILYVYDLGSQNFNWHAIMTLFVLFLAAIIDLLSNISFGFSRENINSQSLNITKFLHYIIITFGVISHKIWTQSVYLNAFLAVLFVFLFFLAAHSLMKNERYKNILMRLYLLVICEHLKLILQNFMVGNISSILLFCSIVISQILFQLYKIIVKTKSLDQYLIKEQYFQPSFQLCKYLYDDCYDSKMENQIHLLIQNTFISNKRQYNIVIFQKILQIMKNSTSFMERILIAEVYIESKGRLLMAKKIIQNIKQKSSCLSIIQKILLYRLQEKIQYKYDQNATIIHSPIFQQLIISEQFRNLLLKTSLKKISLNEYIKRTEIDIKKLRSIVNALVQLQKQTVQKFSSIKIREANIDVLYIFFQVEVMRDIVRADQLSEMIQLTKLEQIDLNLDQKLFVQCRLQKQEDLKIMKIGNNTYSLLGFTKKELEGQKIDILLPTFYRQSHKKYMDYKLQGSLESVYLYQKTTILKLCSGCYMQCRVLLKLNYLFGEELVLIGCFYLPSVSKYNMDGYLFINQKGLIVQCSEQFSQLDSRTNNPHHKNEYFIDNNQDMFPPIQQKHQPTITQYYPLLQFFTSEKICFYAQIQKNNHSSQSQQQVRPITYTHQTSSNYQPSQINKYQSQMQILSETIFHKEYIILLVLSFILMIGIFISQGELISAVQIKASHQLYVLNYKRFFQYYNYSYKIGMAMNYIDLNYQFNYTSNNVNFDLINETLMLQDANQQLKIFNGPSYSIKSSVPNLTYYKTNYQLVQQMISNAYMYQQFQNDSFVRSQSLSKIRFNMESLFISSLLDYRVNFVNKMNNFESQDKTTDRVSVAWIMVLTFLIYFIFARLQYKIRCDERDCLKFICSSKPNPEDILAIKKFINRISTQKIVNQYGNHFDEAISLHKQNITERDSQISQRQLSANNLISRSLRQSQVQQNHKEQFQQSPINKTSILFKQRNSQKIILLVPLFFILTIWGLVLGNLILNSNIKDIDEVVSSNSIITAYRPSAFYSRAMVNVLNLICLKSIQNPINTSNFDKYIPSYYTYLSSSLTIPVFTQMAIAQFSQFKVSYFQLGNVPMCNILSCLPEYQSQINLVYINTILKFSESIPMIQNLTINSNLTYLSQQLQNGSLKELVDLIFYTEELIRVWVIDTCYIYLENYEVYISNLQSSKFSFIGSIISLTIIGFILLIIFTLYTYFHQVQLWKICKINLPIDFLHEKNIRNQFEI